MKENDPCPFCEKHWKRKTPVFTDANSELEYQFTCRLCMRHYDQSGNLILIDDGLIELKVLRKKGKDIWYAEFKTRIGKVERDFGFSNNA